LVDGRHTKLWSRKWRKEGEISNHAPLGKNNLTESGARGKKPGRVGLGRRIMSQKRSAHRRPHLQMCPTVPLQQRGFSLRATACSIVGFLHERAFLPAHDPRG